MNGFSVICALGRGSARLLCCRRLGRPAPGTPSHEKHRAWLRSWRRARRWHAFGVRAQPLPYRVPWGMFSVGLLRDHGGDVLFYPPAVISVVLAGACLGFLPHNLHRAKIFMGDSGSMLIGLMLAAASTTAAGPVSQNTYGARDVFALLSPFLLAVAVMFVPMLDLLLAIVRRTRAGRSAFSPDKMHLHHRLLQIGHSHRRVVLLIYLWVGIVAFGAASTIFFNPRDTGAVMLGAIVIAGVATVIPLLRRSDDDYDRD
jgi:UDP-GlcNAc:undecaprenyl-phosphate GlcNAc-1-phosphate transferase